MKLLKTEFKILSNIMSFFTKTEQFDKRTGKPLKADFTKYDKQDINSG
jgi:hypothetical protein